LYPEPNRSQSYSSCSSNLSFNNNNNNNNPHLNNSSNNNNNNLHLNLNLNRSPNLYVSSPITVPLTPSGKSKPKPTTHAKRDPALMLHLQTAHRSGVYDMSQTQNRLFR
jgi:hypothetical protein